jgi:hypothetical protein
MGSENKAYYAGPCISTGPYFFLKVDTVTNISAIRISDRSQKHVLVCISAWCILVLVDRMDQCKVWKQQRSSNRRTASSISGE